MPWEKNCAGLPLLNLHIDVVRVHHPLVGVVDGQDREARLARLLRATLRDESRSRFLPPGSRCLGTESPVPYPFEEVPSGPPLAPKGGERIRHHLAGEGTPRIHRAPELMLWSYSKPPPRCLRGLVDEARDVVLGGVPRAVGIEDG